MVVFGDDGVQDGEECLLPCLASFTVLRVSDPDPEVVLGPHLSAYRVDTLPRSLTCRQDRSTKG